MILKLKEPDSIHNFFGVEVFDMPKEKYIALKKEFFGTPISKPQTDLAMANGFWQGDSTDSGIPNNKDTIDWVYIEFFTDMYDDILLAVEVIEKTIDTKIEINDAVIDLLSKIERTNDSTDIDALRARSLHYANDLYDRIA